MYGFVSGRYDEADKKKLIGQNVLRISDDPAPWSVPAVR
jgi:hypothetical protein